MRSDHLAKIRPDPAARGVLHNVRVLDMSRLVAGNMLSLQLADFGADVIKVENPKVGDTLRHWVEEGPAGQKIDLWWQTYARNKRSLAIDLRDDQAREALRQVAKTAHVLIESFRPGTLEAMGLGPDVLHALNPRLIIVRLSGWGQDGPYRELPGFGSLIEGFSGFAHKHVGPKGLPQLPNMALADMIAGLTGAFATMTALREVEVNQGKGQVIDLSLLEPMLAIMGTDVAAYAASGHMKAPDRKLASPRGAYQCKDGGWVALSGSTDAMARRVMEAVGRPELIEDPRFATNEARLEHDADLDAVIADFVKGKSLEECLAHFRERGVTLGPIYDPARLLADTHVAQRQSYVSVNTGKAEFVMHNITPRLSDTPGAIRTPAPELGQHTAEILAEGGLTQAQIEALTREGAARCT